MIGDPRPPAQGEMAPSARPPGRAWRRVSPLALAIGLIISVAAPTADYIAGSRRLEHRAAVYAAQLAPRLEAVLVDGREVAAGRADAYRPVLADFLRAGDVVSVRVLDTAGRSIPPYEYPDPRAAREEYPSPAVASARMGAEHRPAGSVEVGIARAGLLHHTLLLLAVSTAGGVVAALCVSASVQGMRRTEGQLAHLVADLERLGERRHAAAARAEPAFRDLVQGLDAIVWVAEAPGRLVFVSDRAQTALGYPVERWLAEPDFPSACLHPDDRERVGRLFHAAVSEGRAYEAEYRMIAADGRVLWFRDHAAVIADAPAGVRRVRGFMVDVTERRRIEEELEDSREQYRAVIDNVQQVIFKTDVRGRWTLLNPAWAELTGFTVEETLGRSFLDYVHPDDRQRHLELFQPVVTGRSERCGREIRYLTKAGGVRWVEAHSRAAVDARGRLVGTFGMLMDVTDRKRAEEESAAAHGRLHHLLVSSPTVIYSRDPRAGFALTFVSDNAAQVLGYDAGRLLGEEGLWNAIVHPADAGRVHEGLARAGGRGEQSLEYRVFRADGSCRWVRDEWRPVRDAAGHLVEIVGSLVDVTERKHGEDERARLSSAVEQASDCIVITNPDGTIVYVNPAFERATGFGQAEAIGRNPRLVKSGQHPPEFYGQMWATLVRGEPWSGFLVNKRRDGTLYEAEAIIFPVRDAAGRLVNYVGVLRDVTRERRIEEQLRQSQKMEAVGRLAGGVAHDFNNLLTIISGRAELLLQRLGRDNPLSHELDLVLKTSHRAAALTRQLLAFSRKQVLSMQVLDVNAVVINIERMLRRLIGEDIELATALDPGLGRVKADPGQLEQVIMNLAVNARDAMPRGGHLRIETGNVDPAGGGLPTGAAPGPHVLLSVSDDGCGMDRDTRARIFEPFFTTKDVNAGTGLGLATVYGIVKQSGGDIAVDSEPGQGTRFRIYLPRVEEPASSARPGAPGAARGGRETILLVEDEPDVRSLAREFLESAGYSVLEATGGGEALSIAGEHAGPIDLVITDVVMPEIDGRKLIERLRGLRPDTKSLYMSGYTDDAILRYGVLTAEMALLQKPFTAEALIRKVRALLDAGPAPVGAGARPAAGGA